MDPHWHDEEIDVSSKRAFIEKKLNPMYYKEIMVISPKARHRTSFMDLDAMSVSVFTTTAYA